MNIEVRYAIDPIRFKRMNTTELRENFLIEKMFVAGEVTMVYSYFDRAVICSAVPVDGELFLETSSDLASDYFAQHRELGVINIGNKGTIIVDGTEYPMNHCDVLYIGRGSKDIKFNSTNTEEPARFYFISYPAHTKYPTKHAKLGDAELMIIGDDEHANKRTIYKYIHPNGIKSCQLVMGITELAKGNVWNTMTPHTHMRRSEVYMYFDIARDAIVFHLMGEPTETRNIVVRNGEAVISPAWSIHAGAGTRSYSFVWAMGGENQDFDDMDGVDIDEIL